MQMKSSNFSQILSLILFKIQKLHTNSNDFYEKILWILMTHKLNGFEYEIQQFLTNSSHLATICWAIFHNCLQVSI